MAAILEAWAAMVWGIVLGFLYSWPMTLIGLGVSPFIMIGSYF